MKHKIYELYNLSFCSDCGGDIFNGQCLYCGNIYTKYVDLKNEIINWLGGNNKNKTDIFALYKLIDIKEVNEYILENNVDKLVADEYKKIFDKIVNGNCLDYQDENNVIEIFPIISKHKANILIDYIVSLFILDVVLISKELTKFLIVQIIKNLDSKIEVVFTDMNLHTRAQYTYNKISLANYIVDEFYEGKSKLYTYENNEKETARLDFLESIFHEFIHHYQIQRERKELTLIGYLEKKETLLLKEYPEYYSDNYNDLLLEKEADRISQFLANYYYNILCFRNEIRDIRNLIIKQILNEETYIRKVNNVKVNFNDLFDDYIVSNKDVLKKYPIFNLEYIQSNDGSIRRKNKNELVDTLIYGEYPDDINNYLLNLLQNMKNNEETVR